MVSHATPRTDHPARPNTAPTSTPYDTAAEIYLASGTWPIPVRGKNIPAKGATGYDGTVTIDKITAWTHHDPTRRATAGRGHGMDNIAIRHDLTIAIDIDVYGGKNGATHLDAHTTEHDLPPLPATWSSTARGDDSPSRQYLYRIPDAVRFRTKPCPDVELCTWHHRYTVCAPSTHPDTGAAYTWYLPGTTGTPPTWGPPTDRYPRADSFAELPPPWIDHLRGPAPDADRDIEVLGIAELVATFAPGPPDALTRALTDRWSTRHIGHDEFKSAAIHTIMLGREGHPGAADLLRLLWTRYTTYLRAARPHLADSEARNLIRACATLAQQKPLQAATDDDLDLYLTTYTRHHDPARLTRRTRWMRDDDPARLTHHARHLVHDSIQGHYPAQDAAIALLHGYRHHGITDPAAAKTTLRLALGAVLNAEAGT